MFQTRIISVVTLVVNIVNMYFFFDSIGKSDMKLGRNVARTFLDYYKLVGYISAKPSSSINPKSTRNADNQQQLDLGYDDRYDSNISL